MLFSIIVPVYNVEKYLHQCVESVLKQSFKDWELILVNDGSLDNSGAICDQYAKKDCRIRVIHKQNGGSSSARNRGFRNARGKFIYFLDSDDYFSTEAALDAAYRCIVANKTDVVLVSHSKFYESKAKKIKADIAKYQNISEYSGYDVVDFLIENERFEISPWSKIVRRDFLIEHNIYFDENVRVGEDFEWTFQLYNAGPKVSGTGIDFMTYRVRDNSLCSERNPIGWKSRYNLIDKWGKSNFAIEHPNVLTYLAYQYYLMLGDIHNIKDKNMRESAYSQTKLVKDITKNKNTNKTKICWGILKVFGERNASVVFDYIMKKKRR